MTDLQRDSLNDFFVHLFNKILCLEERALTQVGAQDLSVKELHVLEAVDGQSALGRSTMTAVAEALSVQASTLTTAVNTLVRKGYVARRRPPEDRRSVLLALTEKGEQANLRHSRFHQQMIDSVAQQLSQEELGVLIGSLRRLDRFFNEMAQAPRADGARQG